ncbi:MAG: hypothetical protein HY901_24840 [Deltaproteobacteria bacterium]|nr:hypothetical protein [Deltaproteobacteria bacterium]
MKPFLTAFAVLFAACSLAPEQGDADAEATADAGATVLDAAVISAHLMGFSGVASLPRDSAAAQPFLTAMGYASQQAYQDDMVSRMGALSAPMARGHIFYAGQGQFAVEGVVARLEAAGADVYGWVNPAGPFEALDAQFDAALTALVKAHPAIRVWQLGNEPDLLWKDPALYPAFFLRAQPLIRAACPDCRIALAGISNQYDSSSANYQLFDGYVSAIASGSYTGKAFDIFDFHYYKEAPRSDEIASAASSYRAILHKYGMDEVALWCTETGLYTGDPPSPQLGPRTEEEQARDLPKLVSWMARSGVERIYLWTLVEAVEADGIAGLFDSMGLVYNGIGSETSQGIAAGTAKKAYTTFGLLAKALQDITGATELSAGVERIETAAGPVFVVWSEGGSVQASLTGLSASKVKVQELVPDAQGQTPSTSADVVDGAVFIDLTANPRLVTLVP